MSGVAVLRYLLANNAAVIAVVPAARIMAGSLPINTVLPAIELAQISSVVAFRSIRLTEQARTHTDRVQVTALFKDTDAGGTGYPGVKALLKKMFWACPNQYAVVNGVLCQSIIPDLEQVGAADEGTDLISGSRDFMVTYQEVPPDNAMLNEDAATPILTPDLQYILLE